MSNQLQKIRERLGLSQMEMALASGVSIPLISRVERGHVQWANLQSRTRQCLAIAYGLDPATGHPTPIEEAAPASSQNS